MKIGKLHNDILKKLILEPVKKQSPPIPEVLAGPSIGEDCALLDFEGDNILISSDPITATEDGIGRLLVTVCANDIAASGGRPVGLTVTALLPPSASEKDLEKIMEDLLGEAKKQNIAILGGHTEITDAVNRIVLSGTVLGRVEKGGCIKTDGARPNDEIVMTKSAGLEGASILAQSFEKQLKQKFGEEFVSCVKKYSEMTSILKEAEIAKKKGATSMHDITEGGILGALAEASLACDYGFEADLRKVCVSTETKEICDFFEVSPYELISSGSLLVTVEDGEGLVDELEKNGINASVIGKVTAAAGGDSHIIDLNGERKPIVPPLADAIYDALSFYAQKNIIFVCTGNTCRSPMAEVFAKSFAEKSGKGYSFTSRGIYAENGEHASENSIIAMSENGFDLSDFKSSPFTERDANESFLILTMTKAHKHAVLEQFENIEGLREKVFTLWEYVSSDEKDISDPYGLDLEAYKRCAAEIRECVEKVLKKLY